MKVVAGLGNPGRRYAETRHNAGWKTLELLAPRYGGVFRPEGRFRGEVAEIPFPGEGKVTLAKPTTFMNRSGEMLGLLGAFLKAGPGDFLVVVDDVALPLGRLRFRTGGSHGGHNGLRSIEEHLRTREYPRLRLGVGGPEGVDLADYVLERFRPDEREAAEAMFGRAAGAVEDWLRLGTEECMNRYNADPAGEKPGPAARPGEDRGAPEGR